MKADFHLHSSFSGDSEAPPEAVIAAGLEHGLTALCFTDHMEADCPYTDASFELDTETYLTSLRTLQTKYAKQIEICLGVELGIQPHLGPRYQNYINQYPFDFVIGSTHLVEGMDPYYPNFWEAHKAPEGIRRYLEVTLENIRAFDDFDVYGHLDYIIRYVPEGRREFHYSDHADLMEEILKLLIEKGHGIEVNTGGYKAGLPVPNPCPDVIRRYRELGGEIVTLGSDAHTPEYVGFRMEDAREVLRACGFRYFAVFRERKPIFYHL